MVKICDFGLARDIYKDPDYVRKGSVSAGPASCPAGGGTRCARRSADCRDPRDRLGFPGRGGGRAEVRDTLLHWGVGHELDADPSACLGAAHAEAHPAWSILELDSQRREPQRPLGDRCVCLVGGTQGGGQAPEGGPTAD